MEVNTMRDELVFMNEYDDVIISYRGNDFEELMDMIYEGDYAEMAEWLEAEKGYDFVDYENEDGTITHEYKYVVATAYIKEMLVENIYNDTKTGTRELFRLVTRVM
jgi:hypothetical protein